jgi:hypothetical protein
VKIYHLLLLCSALLFLGSYLSLPRITFAGQFRTNSSTVNNEIRNYNVFPPDFESLIDPGWNKNGTGEFSFFDFIITSIISGYLGRPAILS